MTILSYQLSLSVAFVRPREAVLAPRLFSVPTQRFLSAYGALPLGLECVGVTIPSARCVRCFDGQFSHLIPSAQSVTPFAQKCVGIFRRAPSFIARCRSDLCRIHRHQAAAGSEQPVGLNGCVCVFVSLSDDLANPSTSRCPTHSGITGIQAFRICGIKSSN